MKPLDKAYEDIIALSDDGILKELTYDYAKLSQIRQLKMEKLDRSIKVFQFFLFVSIIPTIIFLGHFVFSKLIG